VRRGLGDDAQACALRRVRGLRTDRDGWDVEAECGERAGGGAGGEDDEIPVRRLGGPHEPCPIERTEVGVQRVDQMAARALGARQEHAPRLGRELADETLLTRVAGDERRLDARFSERLGCAWTDRRHTREGARAAPGKVCRAVRARDDQPVVAARVDRPVVDRLDLDQRTGNDLVPERLDPGRERAGLLAGTGHDDLHGRRPYELRRRENRGATRAPGRGPVPNPLPPGAKKRT